MTSADALHRILERAELDGWAGSDPYDALLSPLGRAVTRFGGLPRFVLSQLVLRVPAARTFTNPPATVNTKGLALFLGAVTRGRHLLGPKRPRELARELIAEIESRATPAGGGLGWGYPFPWQSRSFWAPAGTPNAVVTVTVGWHALYAAEVFEDANARALGLGAARFLASGLNVTPVAPDAAAISYTAADRTRVVNVSALAGRLLLRAARVGGEPELAVLAGKLLRFVLQAQRPDGSWPYATEKGGAWMDSFHTGYVLESLVHAREMGYPVPDGALSRGIEAYGRFFAPNGAARLTLPESSPFDAHSAAQGMVTYGAVAHSEAASDSRRHSARAAAFAIADWSLRALWIPGESHFAYRIARGWRDEREFLRWVQAWMALGMATVESLRTVEATAPSMPVGVA
ncbi:MAG TPA: hypothetical protein VFM00_08455 [Candidatus Eisenbacteria bacterium]|nr:hypothetical protein [Candidatus Eisenbacteria bacterium]